MQDLNTLIEKCKQIITSEVDNKSICSLYIGGSIKPQDRIKESDIDLIGIVNDNFPEDLEMQINKILKASIREMKCKLRVLYLSELKGNKQKGFISRLLPIRLFIRRIPFFPLIWGTPLKIEDTIGVYTLEEEVEIYNQLINEYIIKSKSIKNQIPFEWIPKAVLYLAALELVIVKKAEFTTSFSEIQRLWNSDRKHIVHDSINIRQRNDILSETDKAEFLSKTIKYIMKMQNTVGKKRS